MQYFYWLSFNLPGIIHDQIRSAEFVSPRMSKKNELIRDAWKISYNQIQIHSII